MSSIPPEKIQEMKAELGVHQKPPEIPLEDWTRLEEKYGIGCPTDIQARIKKRFERIGKIRPDVFNKLVKRTAESRGEASEIIVNFIKNEIPIKTLRNDKQEEIWVYIGGIYAPQGRTYINELCRDILGDSFTTQIFNEVLHKIEADTYISEDLFFKPNNSEEIAVQNGILNIKTRKLENFTAEKIFFQKLPMKYEYSAKCEKIFSFLVDVLENAEDTQLIQELLGYCLLKNYPIEKAFMFYGTGRNGKGQTLELFKNFLGADNCSAVTLQRLSDETDFSVCELQNKLANIGGDISGNLLKDTAMFKSLTGNDTVSAKRKFLSDLKFKNHAKLIFSCNKLPRSGDTSPGFWDRWILIKFPWRFEYLEIIENTPEEERRNLKPRKNDITACFYEPLQLAGLLNWALDGLDRLLKQEHFTFTKSNQKVKERWITEADSLAAFCSENILEEYEGMIKKEDFRQAYSLYCRSKKVEAVSDKEIKSHLTEEFGAFDDRFRQEDLQIPIWKNIKFGKGGKDGKGFSTYNKITFFDIGVKQHTNLTNLTVTDGEKNNVTPVTLDFWNFISSYGQQGVTKEEFSTHFKLDEKKAAGCLAELLIKGDIMQPKINNFVAVVR